MAELIYLSLPSWFHRASKTKDQLNTLTGKQSMWRGPYSPQVKPVTGIRKLPRVLLEMQNFKPKPRSSESAATFYQEL